MVLSVVIKGRVWKLGDHINTDLLHPPSYFSLDKEIMNKGLKQGMERLGSNINPGFDEDGFIIVAGENFGCGSSRETSVRALVSSGVRCVVARSFARIFMRSLVNLCIPPICCKAVQDGVDDGDLILVKMEEGYLEVAGGESFSIDPIDDHYRKILQCGGLIPYLEKERNGNGI